MATDREASLKRFRSWVEQHGKIVVNAHDPRGDWMRCYFDECAKLFVDEVAGAEERGYQRGRKAKKL